MARILIYGDTAAGSGGWCYAETLKDLTHDVRALPTLEQQPGFRTWSSRLYRKAFGNVREADRFAHVTNLKREVDRFDPEIVIVLKGLYLAAEDIGWLKGSGRWVCNINHDDFFSTNRNNWTAIQRRAISAYDFIFTTRAVNVEEVKPLNPNVEFFPFSYYPKIHRIIECRAEERSRWASDVLFVGTYERPRAMILEELLRRTSVALAIHGAQWERLPLSSPLRDCVLSSGVQLDEYCKAIGNSLIALGFLRKENRDDYTQRTFEIPACGGVLLAERTKRHLEYYDEGVEAEFFDPNSAEELCLKVQSLLADDNRREKMRVAGNEAVRRGGHAYANRLSRLLQLYESR